MAKWNMTAVVYIEILLYLVVSVILYHLPWQKDSNNICVVVVIGYGQKEFIL